MIEKKYKIGLDLLSEKYQNSLNKKPTQKIHLKVS